MASATKVESGGVSNQTVLQSIFALEEEIAENEGQLSLNFNKNQETQLQLAQSQAQISHDQCQAFLAQLTKMTSQQSTVSRWETIAKWVGVGVTILAGLALCETPVGYAMLVGVSALMASGLLNKPIADLGNAIGSAIGSSSSDTTWGNVIAQVIVIATLTVLTAGAEGIYAGMQKVAASATDAAVDGAEEAAESAAISPEVPASPASSVNPSDFAPRLTGAVRGVLGTTIASTNVLGELVSQVGNACSSSDSKKKTIIETAITILANLAAVVASLYAGNINGLSQSFSEGAQAALSKLTLGTQIGLAGVDIGTGRATYEMAETEFAMAPLQATMQFTQGMMQVSDSISEASAEVNKSLLSTYEGLFEIDFGAAFTGANEAIQG